MTKSGCPGCGNKPDLPGVGLVVVITLLFGVFGLIPAALRTQDAGMRGVRTGSYYKAFGWTFVTSIIVSVGLVLGTFALLGRSVRNTATYTPVAVAEPAAAATDSATYTSGDGSSYPCSSYHPSGSDRDGIASYNASCTSSSGFHSMVYGTEYDGTAAASSDGAQAGSVTEPTVEPGTPAPSSRDFTGSVSFDHFTVSVTGDDTTNGSVTTQVQVCVTVPVESYADGRTPVRRNAWTARTASGAVVDAVVPGDMSTAYPLRDTLLQGECASGGVQFPASPGDPIESIVYHNTMGDEHVFGS